jgi:hypothetical protein
LSISHLCHHTTVNITYLEHYLGAICGERLCLIQKLLVSKEGLTRSIQLQVVRVDWHQAELCERDSEVVDSGILHLHHRNLELMSESEVKDLHGSGNLRYVTY